MTKEEAKHIVDVAFCVPQAIRRAGENRTYFEDEIREAKGMALKALEQEPCEYAISRQAVIDGINRYFHDDCYQRTSIQDCRDCLIEDVIKPLPPVTPQPKTGHWEQYGNSWEDKFKCSECGKEQPKIICCERIIGHWSDYCPNCGAKMEEKECIRNHP